MPDLTTLAPWLLVAALALAAAVLAWRSGSPWVHRVVAILLVPLALLLGAWAWHRDERRRVAARNAEVDRQRDARVADARAEEAAAVERAREREAGAKQRDPLDWINSLRPPGAGVVLLVLALAAPARAEPPPCEPLPEPGWAACPVDRIALARDAVAEAERREAEAVARAERLERELAAERDAAALRTCPQQVDVVPWAIAGAGVGAAIVAILALLVGGR